MFNIVLCGQKYFAASVFRRLMTMDGVSVICVFAPLGNDSLRKAAITHNVSIRLAGTLAEGTLPEGTDLIVCAHSHDFVGKATRRRSTYGGIGFHPSPLPLYRGKSAIEWQVKLNEKITAGTTYRLTGVMDGGHILEQEFFFIGPKDTVKSLWENKFQPLGVDLLEKSVRGVMEEGMLYGDEQDESIASWFPSMEREPVRRPDLPMLEHITYDNEVVAIKNEKITPCKIAGDTDYKKLERR